MDKRTLIAFILIAIVLIFYDDYVRWLYPPPPVDESDSTMVTREVVRETHTPSESSNETWIEPGKDTESIPQVEAAPVIPVIQSDTIPERIVTVETDHMRLKLSSDGARLTSLVLRPNGKYLKEDLELIPEDEFARPGFRFWTMNGPVETVDIDFQLVGFDFENSPRISLSGTVKRRVEFFAQIDSIRKLSVHYDFKGDGYSFVSGCSSPDLGRMWVRDYAEAYWENGLAETEFLPEDEDDEEAYGASFDMDDVSLASLNPGSVQNKGMYTKAFSFFAGDELETMKFKPGKPEVMGPLSGDTKWTAIRSKYFLAALIPENTSANAAWMINGSDSGLVAENYDNYFSVGLRMPVASSTQDLQVRVYAGPLDQDYMESVDPSLEETMSWGWSVIAPFSRIILWTLKKMGNVIPNYGICIILFSILIKIVVWPLTHKSHQSMAAMQSVQPKLQALREKYGKDPQRMQKETMKLYKEEGINPMGGCLPMLLQMPLLWAMFIIFSSTIEFRGAPFILWITDLSKPDVILPLPFSIPLYGAHIALMPIIMGISTFYQSKMTMTDPNQKIMLYFMPIFMVAIFNNFPSGLTFYYTLFNIWTLLQQRMMPARKPQPVEAKKKGA